MTATEPVRFNTDFLVPKFGSCEYSLNHPNESPLHLFREHTKDILSQPQGEQEIEVRTGIESQTHVDLFL